MVSARTRTSTEQVAPGTARLRLDYIDGLRGAACLYVVMYHVFLLWPVSSQAIGGAHLLSLRILTKFAAFGHIGVNVFLVLSGFCLFFPLCRKADGSRSLPRLVLGTYARRRSRRILPPYLAAVALCSLLPLWNPWAAAVYPLPTPMQLLTHVLLIHNLFPSAILSIDGPLWSLALEAQLYVVFPLLIVLFRRVGPAPFLAVVFAVSLGFRIVAWYPFHGQSLPLQAQFALMSALPGRMFEFAAGMTAAYLVAQAHRSGFTPRLRAVSCAAVLLGACVAYGADKMYGERSPLTDPFWGLLAFGLILGAGEGKFPPLHLFRWRPAVRIGLISYSIYLLHEPLVRLTGTYVRQASIGPLPALLGFLVLGGPLLLGCCAAFYFAFERPFLAPQASGNGPAARRRSSGNSGDAVAARALPAEPSPSI